MFCFSCLSQSVSWSPSSSTTALSTSTLAGASGDCISIFQYSYVFRSLNFVSRERPISAQAHPCWNVGDAHCGGVFPLIALRLVTGVGMSTRACGVICHNCWYFDCLFNEYLADFMFCGSVWDALSCRPSYCSSGHLHSQVRAICDPKLAKMISTLSICDIFWYRPITLWHQRSQHWLHYHIVMLKSRHWFQWTESLQC